MTFNKVLVFYSKVLHVFIRFSDSSLIICAFINVTVHMYMYG